MDKIVILTGREQELVTEMSKKAENEYRQMHSDDPAMQRIWRHRIREYIVLGDKIKHADLA